MTTFNFTVRAEDTLGAYADRDFSIKVKNTLVDRYMLVTSSDAYTSVNGTNWTLRTGMGGNEVSYGGGIWLISSSVTQYRTSPDGINFTTRTYPGTGVDVYPKWYNDRWHLMTLNGTYMTSTDGITWTQVGNTLPSYNPAGQTFSSRQLAFGDGKIAIGHPTSANMWISHNNGTTWALQSLSLPFGTTPTTLISYHAGVWILIGGQLTATKLIYSTDMTSFYQGSGPNTPSNAQLYNSLYCNGYTIVVPRASSGTTGNFISRTMNGKDYTSHTTTGQNMVAGGSDRVNMMHTKGKLVLVSTRPAGAGVVSMQESPDFGATWTVPTAAASGLPANLGINSIAKTR